MGVSVFVMPLHTWLSGGFRTTWGPDSDTATSPRRRRSEEDAERLRDDFLSRLETLLGSRPDWDESGPARSATAFSVHSFSLPFLQARRWAYRMKLTQLSTLETPQIWIPTEFESAFPLDSLWGGDGEVFVGSLPCLKRELEQLLHGLAQEQEAEDWAELREVAKVAQALRHVATVGVEADMPVIVEG